MKSPAPDTYMHTYMYINSYCSHILFYALNTISSIFFHDSRLFTIFTTNFFGRKVQFRMHAFNVLSSVACRVCCHLFVAQICACFFFLISNSLSHFRCDNFFFVFQVQINNLLLTQYVYEFHIYILSNREKSIKSK